MTNLIKDIFCNIYKHWRCYDDGDGRWDSWCEHLEVTYEVEKNLDKSYCPYYEEED